MIEVVDASVACKWLVKEEGSVEALALLEESEGLIAPDLIIPEVSSALSKKLLAGEIESRQAQVAVVELAGFFEELVPGLRLASRALAIAEDLRHSVYDCFYLALAEARGTRLVTADTAFVRRVRGTRWARQVSVI